MEGFTWALLPACLLASAVLTGAVRRYAIRESMLDLPNGRSSHVRATPRGGGLAIAAATLAGIGAAGALGWMDGRLSLALLAGGVLIAGVGWIDDRSHVPASIRAAVHFAAAGGAVWAIGGMGEVRVGGVELDVGATGTILAVVGIVWLTNLYNFMDGVDGIAAVEAVSVGVAGGILLWMGGHGGMALAAGTIAAAAGGFLLWNWEPARIFMGDVGSGLLGFLFGTLAVASETAGAVPLLVWLLLLGVFVVDATVTLLRRVLRGERWYSAHRDHAYQRAVRAGASHARVSTTVLLLNLGLGVAAVAAMLVPEAVIAVLALAYGALLAIYYRIERRYPLGSDRSAPSPGGSRDEPGPPLPGPNSLR